MPSNYTNKNDTILIVCHECDALQTIPSISAGSHIECVCCDSSLLKNHSGGIDRPLALITACLILFVFSNTFPILQLTIAEIESETTLTAAAIVFFQNGSPEMALIIWMFSVLFPGICILGLFYILFSIRYDLNWTHTKLFLIWTKRLMPWGMMDVFLLAVLVALVKLVALADVILGIGFISFVCLILCYAAALSSIEIQLLWHCIDDNISCDQTHE